MSYSDFETKAKELLKSGRLSGSRLQALSALAIENVENDAQLVSYLFRLHKKATPDQKLSSLYIIDAISRDMRSATRKASTQDLKATRNSPASFLKKMEVCVERVLDEVWKNGKPEYRSKVLRVLGIWEAGSTFSSKLLDQMKAKFEAAQVNEGTQITTASNTSESAASQSLRIPAPTTASTSSPLSSTTIPALAPISSSNFISPDTLAAIIAAGRSGTQSQPPGTSQQPPSLPTATLTSQNPDSAALQALLQSLTGSSAPASSVPYGTRSHDGSHSTDTEKRLLLNGRALDVEEGPLPKRPRLDESPSPPPFEMIETASTRKRSRSRSKSRASSDMSEDSGSEVAVATSSVRHQTASESHPSRPLSAPHEQTQSADVSRPPANGKVQSLLNDGIRRANDIRSQWQKPSASALPPEPKWAPQKEGFDPYDPSDWQRWGEMMLATCGFVPTNEQIFVSMHMLNGSAPAASQKVLQSQSADKT